MSLEGEQSPGEFACSELRVACWLHSQVDEEYPPDHGSVDTVELLLVLAPVLSRVFSSRQILGRGSSKETVTLTGNFTKTRSQKIMRVGKFMCKII